MLGIIIALVLVISVETIVLAEIIYKSSHPGFIFEIDDSDPDDVKMSIVCNVDVQPDRLYFLKTVRRKK